MRLHHTPNIFFCPVPGQTKSLASVSGPIEVRIAHEHPSQATLDVQVRPLPGIPGTDAKALATTLRSIFAPSLFLSHHPRTLVQVVAQALCGSESGSGTGSAGRGWNASLVASLVNATAAALVNAASVPMRGVVCAVAVGRLRSDLVQEEDRKSTRLDRKSTRLNSSHSGESRMPSSA